MLCRGSAQEDSDAMSWSKSFGITFGQHVVVFHSSLVDSTRWIVTVKSQHNRFNTHIVLPT